MAASVCFGFVVRFPQLHTQKGRFTWLYVHPVQAGAMLAVATVLMAGYAITTGLDRAGPRWRLPVYVALFAVCAAGLVATKTRGAVLGAIVGVLVLVWTRWRGQRKVEVGVVGAVALIAVALTTSSAIEDFFARGESAARLATLNSRTNLWGFAFERFAEHPSTASASRRRVGCSSTRSGSAAATTHSSTCWWTPGCWARSRGSRCWGACC